MIGNDATSDEFVLLVLIIQLLNYLCRQEDLLYFKDFILFVISGLLLHVLQELTEQWDVHLLFIFFYSRHQDLEDLRDRYPKKEERSISTRDKGVLSGVQEKGSKYSYSEKPSETEGGNATELLRDRSLNSKVPISIELVKKISLVEE